MGRVVVMGRVMKLMFECHWYDYTCLHHFFAITEECTHLMGSDKILFVILV